jgi:hypothetical protein
MRAHFTRELLADLCRIERITAMGEPVAAIAYGMQLTPLRPQRRNRFPDGAAAHAERPRQRLTGVEPPIGKLGEYLRDERCLLLTRSGGL